MSRLRAVCSTAWVSSGCGASSREDPVAVLQRGLHRRGEPHRVTQVVRPSSRRRTPAARAGRTGSRSRTAPPVSSGRGPPAPRPARRGSDRPEASARRRRRPPRAPSRRAAPRLRPARGPSAVAPPITVDCGEATTATTTSSTPRADQFRKHLLGRQFHRRHRAGTGDAWTSAASGGRSRAPRLPATARPRRPRPRPRPASAR